MELPLIPWHVFLEALKNQKPATLERWLRGWCFADEGVIGADEKGEAPVHQRPTRNWAVQVRAQGLLH